MSVEQRYAGMLLIKKLKFIKYPEDWAERNLEIKMMKTKQHWIFLYFDKKELFCYVKLVKYTPWVYIKKKKGVVPFKQRGGSKYRN